MIADFRAFLLKANAVALAIGVIIGAAIGSVVSALVADLVMPLISVVLPSGSWREAKIVLSRGFDPTGKPTENAILYGHFLGTTIDFLLIMLIVYLLMKALVREAAPPPTKACPECLEALPIEARRCRACTAAV
ncbi:MAG TPA: large conductance mechanosensitive channel protein MscL [Thermoanaerobaculia bacterium]|nr:large conductance mechanosensitive channel protein MscL [Thermoanaerobaculia bacterium]